MALLRPSILRPCFASLLFCLTAVASDAPDPAAVREEIKERYERRLKEIFE